MENHEMKYSIEYECVNCGHKVVYFFTNSNEAKADHSFSTCPKHPLALMGVSGMTSHNFRLSSDQTEDQKVYILSLKSMGAEELVDAFGNASAGDDFEGESTEWCSWTASVLREELIARCESHGS